MYPESSHYLLILLICCLLLTGCLSNEYAVSESSAPQEVKLFFREDFKQIPAQIPVTQAHVQTPDLLLARHGPGGDLIKKSHHDTIPGDPWYVWSGKCNARWALTLQKKNVLVDLSSGGRIRWCTRQSGARHLKVILGLEDGTWLVSDRGSGPTPDWHEFSIEIADVKWYKLDIRTIKTGNPEVRPDLSRVRSIGWTDLNVGGGSSACTRLDWIEVYGKEIIYK